MAYVRSSDKKIVDEMTPEQIEDFRVRKSLKIFCNSLKKPFQQNSFIVIDKDGDGIINSQDLLDVMKSLGGNPTEAEVQEMIHEVDEEGKGAINFNEFLKVMAQKLQVANDEDEDIIEAFKVFDLDRDGFVSVDEMKSVLSSFGLSLPRNEIEDMFASVDIDNDGQLNFEEFAELMKFSSIFALESEEGEPSNPPLSPKKVIFEE